MNGSPGDDGPVAKRTVWVVAMEAVMGPGASTVDLLDLGQVLEAVARVDPGCPSPVALHGTDRHAMHVAVRAPDMANAISLAAVRLREAWQARGVVGWELARVSGQTWQEYQSELAPAGR